MPRFVIERQYLLPVYEQLLIEAPNLEAALVKDLGNAFERELPELARLVMPGARRGDRDAFELALVEAVLHAPSWTLRGGTREILRGIIARGLGLR